MQNRIRRGAVLAAAALSTAAVLAAPLPVTGPEPAAAGAAAAASATRERLAERSNIVYGSVRDASGNRRKLRLDLWLPTGTEARRPAVVLAHGGGFRSGSRKHRRVRALASTLVEHGYVTVSISYRLGLAHSPRRVKGIRLVRSTAARQAQHDLQAAVRFLRRKATRWAIDRKRIGALGVSAGAIAALRTAFNPEDPGRSGNRGRRSDIAAAVSLWGASDPRMIERGAPPILMFHGREDPVVRFRLATRTCVATRHRDNTCRRRWWAGDGHSPWHRTPEIERTTLRFLERHLG